MSKNVFVIKRPYVSNGLRRTYFKNMEIFEATIEDTNRYKVFRTYNFLAGSKKWKVKKTNDIIRTNDPIRSEINLNHTCETMLFENFELAYITKTLLIDKLKKQYVKELKELEAMMNRNCPSVTYHFEHINERYPEYMI